MGMGLRLGLGLNTAAMGASAIPGAAPTALPIAPSIQIHVPTATVTMKGDGTFTGWIASGTGESGATVNILHVTTFDPTICQELREGVVLKAGAIAGTKILGMFAESTGGAGRYYVDTAQTVGSSGSPITITVQGTNIASISDIQNRCPLTAADNYGPVFELDDAGRPSLLCNGGYNNFRKWLRNTTVASLDSHNMTWIVVGCIYQPTYDGNVAVGNCIIGLGAYENTPNTITGLRLGLTAGFPTVGSTNIANANPTQVAQVKKMFHGHQLQLLGMSMITPDGLNGSTSTGGATGIILKNEQQLNSLGVTGSGSNRSINYAGLTFNAEPKAPGGGSGANGTWMRVYEIIGFVNGELGTSAAALPAKLLQIQNAVMANWGIAPVTKRLTLLGDSRTSYGLTRIGSQPNDGSEISFGTILARPGYAFAVPNGTEVLTCSVGGSGLNTMWGLLDQTADSTFIGLASPIASKYLLGGGGDYVSVMSGINDVSVGAHFPSSDAANWTNNSPNGGRYSRSVAAYGDDCYNGADYTFSFQLSAAVANNSKTLSITNVTGTIAGGGVFTSSGWASGMTLANSTDATGLNWNLCFGQSPGVASGTTVTGKLGSYLSFFNSLLARGIKVGVIGEPVGGGNFFPTAQARFRVRMAGFVADTATAYPNMTVYTDGALITLGGVAPFFAGFSGYSSGPVCYADGVHLSARGKYRYVEGGDTPQYGYSALVKALLAK